jgi:hypothetical protein
MVAALVNEIRVRSVSGAILTRGIEGKALRTEACPIGTVSTGSLAVRSRQLVTHSACLTDFDVVFFVEVNLASNNVYCYLLCCKRR